MILDEVEELAARFVELRKQIKKGATKKVEKEYEKLKSECAKKLDYLIINKSRRYKSFDNYEDLLQDGRLALMMALDKYEPSKGSLYWWANQYIKTKIVREANRHSTMKIPIRHAKDTKPYKVRYMPLMIDDSEDAQKTTERKQISDIVQKAIDSLPDIQAKAIRFHADMMNGRKPATIKEISRQLDVTKTEYLRALSEAKSALKEKLSGFQKEM